MVSVTSGSLELLACVLAMLIDTDLEQNQPYDLSKFNGFTSDEICGFNLLLSAIYNRPCELRHPDYLSILTELAEYYCALPILSRTLDGSLINSPNFCQQVRGYAF